MNTIARFDTELFMLINTRLTAPFLDSFMPYVTDKLNFLGAIIVSAVLIWVLGKRRDRAGLVTLVLLVLASDLFCNQLKHLFMRIRPCNAIEGIRVLAGCGGSYSMPSGHATNIFAAMVFLTARYRRLFPLFLSIAFIVAYSRVYVGVHYPSDVIAGAGLGTVMALIFTKAEGLILSRYIDKKEEERVEL